MIWLSRWKALAVKPHNPCSIPTTHIGEEENSFLKVVSDFQAHACETDRQIRCKEGKKITNYTLDKNKSVIIIYSKYLTTSMRTEIVILKDCAGLGI